MTNGKSSSDRRVTVSPLLLVLGAAILWSTGGLFIKATSLSAFELSFGRSLLAAITIAIVTRREGFGLNRVSAITSILYAALLLLFVLATKLTTAANAIFLQYTAPVYVLILEPLFYKERFRRRDLITVAACVGGMTLFFVGKLIVVLICAPAFFGAARRGISAADLARISYLGIVQIGCAYLLFTLAMARGLRSLDASIVGYIEPVLNPVWVFLFIGEQPSGWAIVGGAIIIASVMTHMLVEAKA